MSSDMVNLAALLCRGACNKAMETAQYNYLRKNDITRVQERMIIKLHVFVLLLMYSDTFSKTFVENYNFYLQGQLSFFLGSFKRKI